MLNLVLDVLFGRKDARILALTTSISLFVTILAMTLILAKRSPGLRIKGLLPRIGKMILAAALAYLVATVGMWLCDPIAGRGILARLCALVLVAGISLVCYGLLLYRWGVDEMRDLIDAAKGRFR